MIVLVYVDDCILISKGAHLITDFIASLENGPEKYKFTYEGDMEHYLGVEITKSADGSSFTFSQPFLIDRVLNLLAIDQRMTNARDNPVQGPLLSKDVEGPERKASWNYRSAVGMCGYLQNISRPDIAMALHQCARF